jgi:MYXO-CTERM domain-containing protein
MGTQALACRFRLPQKTRPDCNMIPTVSPTPLHLLAALSLTAMSASATTFVYTLEVAETPAYTPSRIVSGRGGTFLAPGNSSNKISATEQTITVDYSTLGDDPLSFTLKAPEGKAFDMQVPTWGSSSLVVVSLFGTITAGAGWFSQELLTSGTSINSTSAAGLPVLGLDSSSYVQLTGPGGDAFEVGGTASTLIPGAHYQFTSITWQTTVPASYNQNFVAQSNLNPATNEPFTYFLARTQGAAGETSTDPGQWLRLVDTQSVPEPGMTALGALAGLTLLRRRR